MAPCLTALRTSDEDGDHSDPFYSCEKLAVVAGGFAVLPVYQVKRKEPMLISVEDVFEAAYLHYCGYPLQDCSTSNRSCTWRFEVPECDYALCQQEMQDSDQTIFYKAFVSSMKSVQHYAKLSRQQMGHFSNWQAQDSTPIMP